MTAGIVSFGAYVPFWRLSKSMLGPKLTGERPVASFDEDSITMAVAAGIDCLKGIDRHSVDGVFFASTTSPYKEKLSAATVATALDLRRDVAVADFANSLRAGTMAVKAALDAVRAGSASRILVVAADCRLGTPDSIWERNCGDGAAAVLIGTSDLVAEMGFAYSIYDEILEVWRSDQDQFIRSAEGRFVATEGYMRLTEEAVRGLMERYSLKTEAFTKVIFGVPDKRRQADLAKSLGFDAQKLQDSLLDQIGDSGCAYPIMLLCAALDEAAAGDALLWSSYGNGSDAFAVTATAGVDKRKNRRTLKEYVRSKQALPDYATFLRWRGILPQQRPMYCLGEIAIPALHREQGQNYRLYAGKCTVCGMVQYPPQKVCVNCQARERFELVRLSDKKAELVTFSRDYGSGAWSPQVPSVASVVNFEGGGRIECFTVDWRSVDDIYAGMPLEMTFRKLYYRDGIHQYLWKSMPLRAPA